MDGARDIFWIKSLTLRLVKRPFRTRSRQCGRPLAGIKDCKRALIRLTLKSTDTVANKQTKIPTNNTIWLNKKKLDP